MRPVIHLVRHAQGFHNLGHDYGDLHDPSLTPLGEQQCRDLQQRFHGHAEVTHLVASPLRRTLQTCLLSFEPAAKNGKKVVALPDAQEISSQPCDTGSDRPVLEAEFGDQVDFSLLTAGWNDKSSASQYAPTSTKLDQRTHNVRLWLQNLAKKAGEDASIVLVSHGGILHFITQDWDDLAEGRGTGWSNTECRSFEFVDPTLEDPAAMIRELDSSWTARRGDTIPLTAAEQKEIRAVIPLSLDTGIPPHVDGTRYKREREMKGSQHPCNGAVVA